MSQATQELPGEALAALERGSKIEAIKSLRMERSIGLKEAKDAVEAFLREHPDVQQKMAGANRQSAQGAVPWLFLVAAIATAAVLWMRSH
jgi:ribosomal protein L7/L12